MRSDVKGNPYEGLEHLAKHGWLSLAQLASIVNVAPITLYQRSHRIHSFKVGNVRRVSEEDALAELDRCRDKHHVAVMLELYQTIQRQLANEQDQDNE